MSNPGDFIIKNGELLKYTGLGGDVIIPEDVTKIGWDAFADCSSLTSIAIPDSVTKIGFGAFSDCSSLTSVEIPAGVTQIESSTFYGCKSLTSITLPEGITTIDNHAFEDCSKLTHIIIPRSVTAIGNCAFEGCKKLIDIGIDPANQSYSSVDGILMSVNQTKLIKCPEGKKGAVTIPQGVTEIGNHAFAYCKKITSITIPESVSKVGWSAFEDCSNMTCVEILGGITEMEEDTFSGCKKLMQFTLSEKIKLKPNMFGGGLPPALTENPLIYLSNMTDAMIRLTVFDSDLWKTLSVDTQADIFLDKQGKTLLSVYQNRIKDPIPLGNEILKRMDEKSPSKICNAVATFMIMFRDKLDESILHEFYNQLKSIKAAKKSLEKINADEPLMAKLGHTTTVIQNLPEAEKQIVKYLLEENLSSADAEKQFQDYYGKIKLPTVQYKDGTNVSNFVLQWLLSTHEKTDVFFFDCTPFVVAGYEKPGLRQEAAEIVDLIDPDSLQNALKELAVNNLGLTGHSKKMYLAYPICRYADPKLMAQLTKEAPKWSSSVSGNAAPPLWTFRKACKYSETRSAMLFADKYHDLSDYAEIRGTDVDTIRDLYLSDVGVNAQGEKSYDLGNQTVVAKLQPDLSFLVVTEAGKTVKSLPKKDADPEKYASANADFIEMKKTAKKIVKNRSAVLFEDFISGRTRKPEEWQEAYLCNPLLRSVAKLVVWKQGKKTFTLTDDGIVTADETVYKIGKTTIAVAHPMEMKPEEVTAWQKYFTAHELKQPFAQIWEPVIDPTTVEKTRYVGCMIPYYRFRSMEKHGIQVNDWDYHNEIDIYFTDCDADVERIDCQRHEINNDDRFEVKSFAFKKYTRQVNHIVAYLDRITVYDRIRKDDTSIELILPNFTLAQITEFIKIATENNCTNVTALLLNYKNEHFSDFDPMEEFTLE